MCDTIAIVSDGEVLFAKNSDRDPNESQILDWQERAAHPAGSTLTCTHIEIPQVEQTWAVLVSRPFWMWGAEMGANEHGLIIGNEAVFTRESVPETGLTGMDLVRLALERSRTADEAVDTITSLIAAHGQGGRCGYENEQLPLPQQLPHRRPRRRAGPGDCRRALGRGRGARYPLHLERAHDPGVRRQTLRPSEDRGVGVQDPSSPHTAACRQRCRRRER